VGRGIWQAIRIRQRVGEVADRKVRDAATGISVPCPGAYLSARRNVDQLIVRGRVIEFGRGSGRALAGERRRCSYLKHLSESHRDPGRLRLKTDRIYIRILQTVSQAIAVLSCRVTGAAGK